MSDRIDKLKMAVEKRFPGEVLHLQSIPVRLEYQGQVNWEGVVEVFRIPEVNHSVRCYAWEYEKDNGIDYVTVPAIVRKTPPGVMTAIEAVKFWLASLGQAGSE